jgi:hypothetical protein
MKHGVVVDRVLDDGCAVVISQRKTSLAEGNYECTDRYEIAIGEVVHLPHVVNELLDLDLIRRAWSGIVGDAAAFAQPVAISGSALVIKTASGAWSHQLSFLEREIIRGVCALRAAPIERLRFRIGKVAA